MKYAVRLLDAVANVALYEFQPAPTPVRRRFFYAICAALACLALTVPDLRAGGAFQSATAFHVPNTWMHVGFRPTVAAELLGRLFLKPDAASTGSRVRALALLGDARGVDCVCACRRCAWFGTDARRTGCVLSGQYAAHLFHGMSRLLDPSGGAVFLARPGMGGTAARRRANGAYATSSSDTERQTLSFAQRWQTSHHVRAHRRPGGDRMGPVGLVCRATNVVGGHPRGPCARSGRMGTAAALESVAQTYGI